MEFEITHHSYRFKATSKDNKYGQWDYIVYNVVFAAYDPNFKNMCLDLSSDWKRVLVAKDKEKAERYFDGLEFENGNIVNKNGLERDKVFMKAWEHQLPHLVYHEKFDVFQLRDYIQDNPATRGIIAYIEDLKNGISYGHFVPYSSLYSCVYNLQYWWD
jgi:hypothetical protein